MRKNQQSEKVTKANKVICFSCGKEGHKVCDRPTKTENFTTRNYIPTTTTADDPSPQF